MCGTWSVRKKATLSLALGGSAVAVGFAMKYMIIWLSSVFYPPPLPCHFDDEVDIAGIPNTCWYAEQQEMQILRAARAFHAATGTLPSSQAVLVQGGYLPPYVVDPFSKTNPLDFRMRVEGDRLEVWSVGPDGQDGGGFANYDPTNGINSVGDIIAVGHF